MIVRLEEKGICSHSDLLGWFYRGPVIHGTWIVSQYFWVIFLSQRCGLHQFRIMLVSGAAREEVTALSPSPRGAFWAHGQQQKTLMCFSNGSALYLCGELRQTGPVLMGSVQQATKPTAEGVEGGLAGANFRLTDNLGFVKGKGCQNPTFLILRTRFTCWKSE